MNCDNASFFSSVFVEKGEMVVATQEISEIFSVAFDLVAKHLPSYYVSDF